MTSGIGTGSTFSFSLTFGVAARQVSPPSPVAAPGLSPLFGLRILLAEDSKDNQLLISAYLKQTATILEIACNGQVAVEKYKAGEFDLVLMDVQMPILDGLTATRAIREWEQQQGLRRTPILALSAHAMLDSFAKSADAGCDEHLTKPITKLALLQAIEAHCTAHKPIRVSAPKEVEELIPWYLDRRRSDLAALNAALQAGHFDAIRILGHDMKGSGAGFGFAAITEIGSSLEAAAKEKSTGQIRTQISALGHYLECVEVVSA